VDDSFGFNIREPLLFEVSDLQGESSEVLLEADDGVHEFLFEVEAGRVLALERNQVTAELHVCQCFLCGQSKADLEHSELGCGRRPQRQIRSERPALKPFTSRLTLCQDRDRYLFRAIQLLVNKL